MSRNLRMMIGYPILIIFLFTSVGLCQGFHNKSIANKLYTNQKYINGINEPLDLDNQVKVFDYIFQMLDTVITVYPTENYYYFELAVNGRDLKGNIALFVNERDKGIINFSYQDKGGACRDCPTTIDKDSKITSKDGLLTEKINDFEYNLTFRGKKVKFILNDVGLIPPNKLNLDTNEEYVGTTYDESGLKFNLIFDNKNKHLFWTLNQEGQTPEVFISYTNSLEVGQRTEFFFYLDSTFHRKVLIGVKKENIDQNNWYDGPFDQLPDNYIKTGRLDLQKYLLQCYPGYKGKIDAYGNFLDDSSSRIAITSYLIYNNREEVLKVYFACKNSFKNHSEFLYNLTKIRVFNSEQITIKSVK